MKKYGRLDFEQHAREKQLAREADARDLESGRRSAEELNRANNLFAALGPSALRNVRIICPELK
jgi:hypothetical protein